MNPENWKLVLAFGGMFLATVTGPILWALRAESRAIRAQTKMDIAGMETRLEARFSKIDLNMAEMEKRLNERIDTRLVHR